ncbi:hypothetical protein GGR55DRAFT_690255 [Xylaria sp. FL0064]|nr:hypothetical protein GGR55DRAFT_690255 [Xylaria sp. FL0064]
MDKELERLRALLKEEQSLREEEQRKREEADRKREEEQRRRESAERRAEGLLPQALQPYLEDCHLLSFAIEIGLLADQPFCENAIFPSSHQLDYVATLISPIASETGLRHFARDAVEIAVQKLVDAAYNDEQLRVSLGILESVTFKSHINLGGSVDTVSTSVERITIAQGSTDATTPPPKPPRTKAHRKAKKSKNGPADRFCVYKRSDGRNVLALAIEYKAPHKLTKDEPEQDVINKNSKSFAFASRSLVAAVITQLFAETFIFFYISEDLSIVYYFVYVPNLDVIEDDENRLYRTAALRSPPLPQAWHDCADGLDTWAVEFENVLRDIPETDRKPPRGSTYKGQRWKGFKRSPIKTRSGCRPTSSSNNPTEKSDSDENGPPSPSSARPLRSTTQRSTPTSTAVRDTQQGGRGRGKGGKSGGRNQRGARTSIQDRSFCTQKCLLGLVTDGPMDDRCPNFSDHRQRHIELLRFLYLIYAMPLYLSGSVGVLFKVRLFSHGYTLVAKGVEKDYLACLQHENQVYDRLHLRLLYYYDGGAGQPLFNMPREATKGAIINAVSKAFKAVHTLKIFHCDAKPRNMLYEAHGSHVIIMDFERAKLISRELLGLISPNRKRKHAVCPGKQNRNDFVKELSSIISSVQRYINQ